MSESKVKKCPYCGMEMEDYKTHAFRMGRKGGEWGPHHWGYS